MTTDRNNMGSDELYRKAHEALNFSMEAQRTMIEGAIDIFMSTTEGVMKEMADRIAAHEGGAEEIEEYVDRVDIRVPLLEAEMNGISIEELTAIKDEQFKNRLIKAVLGHTNKAFEIGATYGRLKLLEEAREARTVKKD